MPVFYSSFIYTSKIIWKQHLLRQTILKKNMIEYSDNGIIIKQIIKSEINKLYITKQAF